MMSLNNESDMVVNYLEMISKPASATVNVGLASPSAALLRSLLGEPRTSYTGDCLPVTNPQLAARIKTKSVGPFNATGHETALSAIFDVLAAVKLEMPDLYALLGSAGMTCARKKKIRQPNGTIKLGASPSNHSWGMAIDIKLNGVLDVQGDNKCLRGLLILSRYFNAAGWYWGVSFPTEDAMHFEASQSLLRRWAKDGKI